MATIGKFKAASYLSNLRSGGGELTLLILGVDSLFVLLRSVDSFNSLSGREMLPSHCKIFETSINNSSNNSLGSLGRSDLLELRG